MDNIGLIVKICRIYLYVYRTQACSEVNMVFYMTVVQDKVKRKCWKNKQ